MSIQAFTVCFDEAGLPDNYKFCLAALRERYKDLLVISEYPPQYDPTGDYRYDSDVTRIFQLTKLGNWLYLDIDTIVYQDYEPADTSAPLFIHDSGIPDIAVIMSHGHTEFFRDLLIAEQAKNIAQKVGCFQSMLWYLRDKIGLLPKGYYKHLGLSGTIKKEEGNAES